ncbi:hypothetical protein [Embleya sp. NBC_00896]|uniref:hypothetical protein n=1 Tax=Embleya sp. NBC_00896 TaxID=2975961 RepID=UPI00386D6BDF|nr:hypothetical protein OG928_20205 [Embleya sp. NBC_00896]
MGTVALAVVVAGSLAAGCGSGGGKKHRSRGGGGSHSSSGKSSSSGSSSSGSSSSGSTSGGSSYTSTPTAPASTRPPATGSFDFDDVNRAMEKAYAGVPTCGVGKWTDADLKTRVPVAHQRRIVEMRSYDCYTKATDTKPALAKLGAYLTFTDEAGARSYVSDVEALTGVVGFIVDDKSVVTVGNSAGLKNPRWVLDQVNLACRQCGKITAI